MPLLLLHFKLRYLKFQFPNQPVTVQVAFRVRRMRRSAGSWGLSPWWLFLYRCHDNKLPVYFEQSTHCRRVAGGVKTVLDPLLFATDNYRLL